MSKDFDDIPSGGLVELIGHNDLSTDSAPLLLLQAARKHGLQGRLKPKKFLGNQVYEMLNLEGKNVVKGAQLDNVQKLRKLNDAIDKANSATGLNIPHAFIEASEFPEISTIYWPATTFRKFAYGGLAKPFSYTYIPAVRY